MRLMRLKFIVFIAMLILLVSGCGTGAKYRVKEAKEKPIAIKPPENKLRVGEKFTYKVEWLGMNVGIITLSVTEIVQINGRQTYHIVATAKAAKIIAKLYNVEDELSTYIDVERFYPLRLEKKQREGGYRADEYTDFDHEKQKAFYFSRLNHSKKEYAFPQGAQDPLSCIYYFRLLDISNRETIFTNVNADEENWLLEARIQKRGIINIKDVGEWEAFMVEPIPWFQGKIKRKAKATIWFSADEKRIPLSVITSGIPLVGTVTVTLQKIE